MSCFWWWRAFVVCWSEFCDFIIIFGGSLNRKSRDPPHHYPKFTKNTVRTTKKPSTRVQNYVDMIMATTAILISRTATMMMMTIMGGRKRRKKTCGKLFSFVFHCSGFFCVFLCKTWTLRKVFFCVFFLCWWKANDGGWGTWDENRGF